MQKISVVIPSYKAEKTIERTIKSLLSQKNVVVEIIVIEDGVFDSTQKVLESYSEYIRLVTFKTNQGAQAARNKGLSLCSHEYVMFLDADDYLEGEMLYGLSESALKHNSDIVFGNCIKRWENGKEDYFFSAEKYKNETQIDVVIRWLTTKAGPAPCSILWKKESLLKIGAWNEAYHKNQDGELVMRAMFNNLKLSHSIVGAGIYIQHSGTRISQRVDKVAFDSQEMLYRYVQKCANKVPQKDNILSALNYYSVGIINSAYSTKDPTLISKWTEIWERKLPKMGLIKYHGYQTYLVHTFYYFFGIKRVRKLLNIIKRFK